MHACLDLGSVGNRDGEWGGLIGSAYKETKVIFLGGVCCVVAVGGKYLTFFCNQGVGPGDWSWSGSCELACGTLHYINILETEIKIEKVL